MKGEGERKVGKRWMEGVRGRDRELWSEGESRAWKGVNRGGESQG